MGSTFREYPQCSPFPINNPSTLWGEGKGEGASFKGDKIKRKNIDKCKRLRRDQTEAEKRLWAILRNRQLSGVKFRRQYPIGNYILDFYSPEYRIGIEADGSQHYEDDIKGKDDIREKELSKVGVEIIRFNDYEILRNIEGVCESILHKIKRK